MIIRSLGLLLLRSMASETPSVEGLRKNICGTYPFGGPTRLPIPSHLVSWDVDWNDYRPPCFTVPGILKGDKPWADAEIGHPNFSPKFNEVDGNLSRKSYECMIKVKDGYPLNPMGRTGLTGRGSLGKWGPNHAADCIVTRWKTDEENKIIKTDDDDTLPIVQFVAIRRQDSGDIAIPGGMVEPGEEPLQAAQREFIEEVLGIDNVDDIEEPTLKDDLNKIFEQHNIIDKCYVDDRRNTDNAWIETCAVNFHISMSLSIFHKMKFKSGSDAKEAFWIDYNPSMTLYASHGVLMKKTIAILYEQWKRNQ